MADFETIEFTVFGDPKSLKRHRHSYKDGIHRSYDPSDDDKRTFLVQALKYKPKTPLNVPLLVSMTFYFARPKSHYGTGKNFNVLKKSAPEFMSINNDVDNLVKLVADALNGTFYKDDSLIVVLHASKKYCEDTPRTEVMICKITSKNA